MGRAMSMRRRRCFCAAMGLIFLMTPLLSSPRLAAASDTESVRAWIDVSATKLAASCSIDISVELRNQGNPVTGARVTAALFAGAGAIDVSTDATNDGGVVQLSVDASAGTGDWIDINVNGGYLTGLPIAAGTGSSCGDAPRDLTVDGEMAISPSVPAAVDSTSSTDAASADASVSSDGPTVNVGGVIFYKQQRNLSCEYAALHIATAAWGDPVSEYSFDDVVGWSDNPHWGYRGDITGLWGNTTDYGVYAEPLADALAQFGFNGDVFYAQGDASALTSRLDAGIPTLVWIAERGDQSHYETTADGTRYMLMAFEHVVVAYGYSDAGVYVSDPASASSKFFAWTDFMPMWNLMDGMGLGVSPS